MAFALSGSTINQTGTEIGSANLVPINGITELAGNRQLAGTSRLISVQGNYTVRESMRLQKFIVTASGSLTLGEVDADGVVMPCVVYLTTTSGFAYPGQAISCDDGATLSLNNSVVVVETGNNQAGFGSFNKLNWTFNAKNSEIIHEQRAWDYLAGNGVINNLTVRNTRCIFFHGSPTELSNLTVIDTEWGIGIDNSTGATVRVTKSKTPRSMIQRGNNYFNLVDTQITDWIGSRFSPQPTSGWRFIKTMQTASVGALANANTTAHTLAGDNSTIDSTSLGADGSLVKEVQWGRVLGNVAGLNNDPNTLSNKMTAEMINTNTGTYKHVDGDYKLPLAVAFVSYNGELQTQEGITFDVSEDAYRENFIMAPNLGVDPLVTELDQAIADAYNTQTGTIRLYDKGKAKFAWGYTNERAVYIRRVGTTLVLGSKNFTATASSVFSQSLTAIVATADVWEDDVTTTGAVVLDAIAENKTIDGASSVRFTTLPTAVTIKDSAQGLVIETAGTYDVSGFEFEGNTVDITKIGDAEITVKTGGKSLIFGGSSTGLTVENTVDVRFVGMPTGLPATATPILIEELDSEGLPLATPVYIEIFSDSVSGEVVASLKPGTKYRWKSDAIGYERSNGDNYRTIDTTGGVADIEVSLTHITYPDGNPIYGNGNAPHLAEMNLDVATVQCRFGDIPAGERVSFETGVQFVEDKLTSHFAMKAGLRQPTLNATAKEIVWENNSPLTLSDESSNTRVVELDFVSKKVDGTLTLASPFNSAYGVRMPETIITATGGDVNLVSVNGVEVTSIDEFKAKADIYTGKFVALSNSDPNRASGTVYGVNGTTASPCDNIEDALAIALENNLDIHVLDSQWAPATLPNAFLGVSWKGEGLGTVVSFPADSGIVTRGASLQNLTVSFSSEWYTVANTQGLEFRNVNISDDLISGIGTVSGLGQFKFYDCIIRGVECLNFYAVGTRFNNSQLTIRGDLAINGGGGTVFITRGNPNSSTADIANFAGAIVISGGSAGPVNILGGSGSIHLLNGVTSRVTVTGRARDSITDNSGGSATVIFVDERGSTHSDEIRARVNTIANNTPNLG